MKYLKSIVVCFFMILATACCKRESEIEPIKPVSTHTYLMYIIGDNSLSSFASENIRLVQKGLLDATEDINVVVYKDSKNQLPSLFQLKKVIDKKTNKSKIDTIYIKRYEEELNSCDPEVFKEVLNTTFEMFDTEVKGLEIWSHGMGWIPSDNKYPTKSTRWIGQDAEANTGQFSNNFFEIWDIREALEACPHLDYITIDACFGGLAEVAQEFDKACDYIYAPITEIMDTGFPYHTMIPVLANCKKTSDVRNTLEECIDDFVKNYTKKNCGYTITLLETKKADNLSKALVKLRNANPTALETLKKEAYWLESHFQHYGRKHVQSRYLFYEFQDYVDYLSNNGADEYKDILKEIADNDIVVRYAASELFTDGFEAIELNGCKGLGVTIPELLINDSNYNRYIVGYGFTKWGKNLGY